MTNYKVGETRAQVLSESDVMSDEFLTFNQAAKRFPAFSEGSLRWMRFNDTNGFNKCVKKIGKKCLISVRDFTKWIASNAA